MKIKLLLLGTILATIPFPARAQSPPPPVPVKTPAVIRFIVDLDSPPFAFKKDGKVTGFDIELGEALAKELGMELQWIDLPFDIPKYANVLEAKEADAALAAISITKDRKYYLDFTRPYFSTDLAVATRGDVKWLSPEFNRGLPGKIIGVMKGTTGQVWARNNLSAEVKTYDSPTSLARALKSGGNLAFAILIDEAILNYLLSRSSLNFKIVERDLDHQDYGIAVSRGNNRLRTGLNAALKKLDTTGVYDKIYGKWFGRVRYQPGG